VLLTTSIKADESQADVGVWSIGANVGVGQRSTFITGQDDVDIYFLPDIHYYGEQFFFDNGTLGFTFEETSNLALSVISELHPYGLYFEQSALGESFNSLYLYSQSISSDAESNNIEDTDAFYLSTSEPNEEANDSIQNPSFVGGEQHLQAYNWPEPELSVDLGAQLNWFINQHQDVTIKLVKDISSRHSGMRAKFTWAYKQSLATVNLKLNLGFDWLDSKSSNYYFGLSPADSDLTHTKYELDTSINPFVSVTVSKPISKDLTFISHLKYLRFDSAIEQSPITNKAYSMTHFIGLHYKLW